MENASKALIVAGAILISILLISVAILIFNSISGVTDNAGDAGSTMELAAAKENAKIVLETMDIENDIIFNNYIKAKYNSEDKRSLSAKEVMELCELVTERCKRLTGKNYSLERTHITNYTDYKVYCDKNNDIIIYNIDNSKKYAVQYLDAYQHVENKQTGISYSIRITEKKI